MGAGCRAILVRPAYSIPKVAFKAKGHRRKLLFDPRSGAMLMAAELTGMTRQRELENQVDGKV